MIALLPLYVIVFIGFFGFAITIPTFTTLLIQPTDPSIIAMPFGERTIILGSLIATYPLGQFFGGSILGAFSDHFGRKKVLVVSLIFAFFCYLGISYALWHLNLWLLFIFLFIGGFFEANVVIAQNAIADVIPKEERLEKFGYVFACISLGYVVGPIVGGFLSNPEYLSWLGYWTPFTFTALLLLCSLFWLLAVFKETFKRKKDGPLLSFRSFTNISHVFLDKRLRFFYLINAMLYFVIFGYFRTYPIYISETFKVTITQLSLFVAYVGAPIVLCNFFVIKPLSRKFSPYFLTTVSAIMLGLFMCLIPLFHFIDSLWGTLLLTTLFIAICLPSCASVLSHAANQNEQGKVMGNNLSLQGAATAMTALAGGVIAAYGVSLPLLVFGILGLLTGIILFFNRKKEQELTL